MYNLHSCNLFSLTLLVFLIFWGSKSLWAQNKMVKGELHFSDNQQIIPNTEIFLYSYPNFKAVTDNKGKFTLKIPDKLADRDSIRIIIRLREDLQPTGLMPIQVNNAMIFLPRPRQYDQKEANDNTLNTLPNQEITPQPTVQQSVAILKNELTNKQIRDSLEFVNLMNVLDYFEKGVLDSEFIISSENLKANNRDNFPVDSPIAIKLNGQKELLGQKALRTGLEASALSFSDLVDALEELDDNFVKAYNIITKQIKSLNKNLNESVILSPSSIKSMRQKVKELEKDLNLLKKNYWEKDAKYKLLILKAEQEVEELKQLLTKDSNFIRLHKIIYYGLNSIIMILLFTLLVLIYLLWRLKKKKQQLSFSLNTIDEQNKEIKAINEELASQRDHLDQQSKRLRNYLEEIHHRVKNHLQRTSSILDLSMSSTQNNTQQIIENIRGRIYSMALIHKKLQNTENLDMVNLKDYIEELVASIADTLRLPSFNISCNTNVAPISLDIATATDLGLIVNELVTNAYKYAFVGLETGEIEVLIPFPKQEHYELIVKDNGIGLPESLDLENANTLGLSLTFGLAESMNGSVIVESGGGTIFKVLFQPKIDSEVLELD